MKYIIFTLFINMSFISSNIMAQRSIFIGTKEYQSVGCEFLNKGFYQSYEYHSTTNIEVAKNGVNGFLSIQYEDEFQTFCSGQLIIYLKNGQTVILAAPFARDYADKTSTSIYRLTAQQINILKKYDISKIRYTKATSFLKEGTTAENRYNSVIQVNFYEEANYNTADDIIVLFDE